MHTGDGGWGWCEVFYLFIYFFIGLLPPFIRIHRYGTRNLNRRINLWNWILYYLDNIFCLLSRPDTPREQDTARDTQRERHRARERKDAGCVFLAERKEVKLYGQTATIIYHSLFKRTAQKADDIWNKKGKFMKLCLRSWEGGRYISSAL